MELKGDIKSLGGNIQSNEDVSRSFKEEEFYWRSFASYIWLITSFPLIFGLFILFANMSIYSPFSWILDSLSLMFSFSTMGAVMLLQIICVIFTISHARALSVNKINHSSKFKFLLFLLRPKQFINLLCFVAASLLICIIFKSYVMDNKVDESGQKNIFVVVLGLFLGFLYTMIYYSKHYYVVQFPVIQQTRLFRVKKMINQCFYDSLWITFKVLQIYYPLYILTGLLPSNILPALLTTYSSGTSSFLSVILSVCNFSMFWMSFSICLSIIFMLQFSNLLLQIFNTQPYTFPLVAGLEHQSKTLSDAMEDSDILLKHLACLDLYLLSRYDVARRLKMFDLSSPGDQPHSWNRVSTECLNIIKKVRLQLMDDHGRRHHLKHGCSLNSPPPQTIGSQALFSEVSNTDKKDYYAQKTWFNSPGLKAFSESPEFKEINGSPSLLTNKVTVSDSTVNIFEHLQISIWCMEGLCNLVAASIKEDRYGVVQQKLPDIVTELLLLLDSCKQFTKTSFNVPLTNHSHHVEAAQISNSHVSSLKIALKTSLYTIADTFGHHITAIRLPADLKSKLLAFLEYGE